ncbi:hypothetical protein DFH28DRAFT_1132004 [Melampsora americana]|nr:hypothetical protein DFH28DRAFT_1132004 [Melampsora americana]
MKFGQIFIGLNLWMDHQASGHSIISHLGMSNGARPSELAIQTGSAFGSSGVGLPAYEKTSREMAVTFKKNYGVDPTTASDRELEEAVVPQAPWHFSWTEAPVIKPDAMSPKVEINPQIGVGWQDLDPDYVGSRHVPADTPVIKPDAISPKVEINPQIGVGWQDLDPDYVGSRHVPADTPVIKPDAISPKVEINPQIGVGWQDLDPNYFGSRRVSAEAPKISQKTDQGSNYEGLADFTPGQWAIIGGTTVSAVGVLNIIGHLGWRAWLKYGKKMDIPIIPEDFTKAWNYLKSKMQRSNIPEYKASDIEMGKARPSPRVHPDTIGDTNSQLSV